MADTAIPARRTNWPAIYASAAAILGAALAFLIWATPVLDGEKQWFDPMIPGGWMAWTFPVALFFWTIASLLVLFTILAIRFPETPRKGVLGIETTRGDRLFIGLLLAAYINLAWVGLGEKLVQWFSLSEEPSVWISFVLSMLVLALVMRKG